jgi:hypothetical protein
MIYQVIHNHAENNPTKDKNLLKIGFFLKFFFQGGKHGILES